MKNLVRLSVAALALFVTQPGHTQPAAPPLADLKAAAEKGDAQAQAKLGDVFRAALDEPTALVWYRKAAAQGVAHAQSELGRILIGYASSPAAKPAMQTQHAEEAIAFFLKAANQGESAAQFGLGQQYASGKFIKQDYAEAYKWFTLAIGSGSNPFDIVGIGAKMARDAVILKMTQEQIATGRSRAAAFVPNTVAATALPEPAWAQEIKLRGLSGPPNRRLAIINGQTFQKGDELVIKAGAKSVKIQCVDVGESSATITGEGLAGQRELKLAPGR